MTEKRFEYRYNCDEDGSEFEIIDTNKDEYYPMIETNETVVKALVNLLNELNNENEQLKNEIEKLSYANEDLLEEKRIWKQMSEEYTKLSYENEQLKSTIKEVLELLSEEVDLFSDKATEHDINAYVELKELDNKDAYYMATATKKAIKILKGCLND